MYEPRNLTDNDTLFFMHIHKTAGTAIRHFLLDRFSMNSLHRDQWVSKALTALLMAGVQPSSDYDAALICGHYPLSIVKRLKRKPHLVTFLREPVSRTLSLFFHLRRSGRLPADWTLEDYLLRSTHVTDLINIQTRWLADCETEGYHYRLNKKVVPAKNRKDNALHLEESLALYNDSRILDKALTNMEKFAFCGITERMHDSVLLLCHTFNWPATGGIPVINRGDYQNEARTVPDSTIEIIKKYNTLDFKLYDEGVRRLEAAVSEPDPKVGDSLSHAKSFEIGTNYVFIDPSGPIEATNWYEPEMETLGNWTGGFRWTGPENPARLVVPVLRSTDLGIVFLVMLDQVSDRNHYSLRLAVNGTAIPLFSHRQANSVTFHGDIEGRLLRNQDTATLDFFVDEYVRPCDLFDSDDARLLGVRVSWIVLYAMDRQSERH